MCSKYMTTGKFAKQVVNKEEAEVIWKAKATVLSSPTVVGMWISTAGG